MTAEIEMNAITKTGRIFMSELCRRPSSVVKEPASKTSLHTILLRKRLERKDRRTAVWGPEWDSARKRHKGMALESEAGYDRNMHNESGSIKISLRLADGEFYPLFRQGDSDTRLMTLSPASPDQDEAYIQFFYHPRDGGGPVRIGVIRFPNLPVEDEVVELQLKVVLGTAGLLSADVFHKGSGRSEGLEMPLPEETSSARGEGLFEWRRGPMARILGVIFVAASLALLLLLARNVSGWGSRAVQPAPMSGQTAGGDS